MGSTLAALITALWALPVFAVFDLIALPLWLLGLPLTFIAARRQATFLVLQPHGDSYYRWRDAWLNWWESPERGCVPQSYLKAVGAHRPLWLSTWIWAMFKNGTEGLPLAGRVAPSSVSEYGGSWWRVAHAGWRVGLSFNWGNCELRFGWKLSHGDSTEPIRMPYEVFAIGRVAA